MLTYTAAEYVVVDNMRERPFKIFCKADKAIPAFALTKILVISQTKNEVLRCKHTLFLMKGKIRAEYHRVTARRMHQIFIKINEKISNWASSPQFSKDDWIARLKAFHRPTLGMSMVHKALVLYPPPFIFAQQNV